MTVPALAPIASPGTIVLLAITTGTMVVSTVPQYALSAVSPWLIDDLDITHAEYGSVFTTYFVVAAVGSLSLGSPAQRLGPRGGVLAVSVAASGGMMILAAAPGLPLLYAGILVCGVAAALSNPASNLALIDHPQRSVLTGVKQSGVQLSALVSGAVVVPLSAELGWRKAGFLCAVVCLLLAPAASRLRRRTGVGAPRSAGPRRASLLGLALYAFAMGSGLSVTIAFLPSFATVGLGGSPAQGGLMIAAFGASAAFGRIGWGYLAVRAPLLRRTSVALSILAGGALVGAGLFLLATSVGLWLAYVAAVLMGLTGAAWNGLVQSLVMDSVDPAESGRATGRVQAGFFAGLATTPLLLGALIDATGSYRLVWLAASGTYVLALLVAIVAVEPRRGRDLQLTAPTDRQRDTTPEDQG